MPLALKPVSSAANPVVSELMARAREGDASRVLCEGWKLVEEAARSGWRFTELVVEGEVASIARAEAIAFQQPPRVALSVPGKLLERLSTVRESQGIIAWAQPPAAWESHTRDWAQAWAGKGPVPCLVAPADPGNAGAVLRVAEAAGSPGVVFCGGGVRPFHPKVARGSMGSLFRVPTISIASLEVPREWRLIGLDASATTSLFELSKDARPTMLVLGNESHGLPPEVRARLDLVVRVPQAGRVESLNLAVATGLGLYVLAHGLVTRMKTD